MSKRCGFADDYKRELCALLLHALNIQDIVNLTTSFLFKRNINSTFQVIADTYSLYLNYSRYEGCYKNKVLKHIHYFSFTSDRDWYFVGEELSKKGSKLSICALAREVKNGTTLIPSMTFSAEETDNGTEKCIGCMTPHRI